MSGGAHEWHQPPGARGRAVDHPDARTAMILGVVALAGGALCVLPIVAAPFAWARGSRALREIEASGGRLIGRGDARAGQVMGIIGTVLLGLAVVVTVVLVVLFAAIAASVVGADPGGV